MSMATRSMNEKSKLGKIEGIFDDVNRRHFHGKITKPAFQLNKRMQKAGSVDLSKWQMDISISYHDKYGWDGELRNTVKHEMIHFYLGITRKPTGHNRYFKELMEKLGCTLHSKPNKRPYKYIFECPHCRKEYKARKLLGKRYSCGKCSDGRFNRKYILQFKARLC